MPESFSYETRVNQRAKNIRITIYPGGRVVLTLPRGASERTGELFIKKRETWITKARARLLNVSAKRGTRKDFLLYKPHAEQIARTLVQKWKTIMGVRVTRITVRNQKTRWGSASRRGALSFNYRIALLPEHVAEYIVVHELAHLRHMNHSKNFWSLVQSVVPDYKARIRELKTLAKDIPY